MRWFEQPEILSYIVDCYAGTDINEKGHTKRQFIWEQLNGDVVLGNSRAFSDHVAERFSLTAQDNRWVDIHTALRALGEVVGPTDSRGPRQYTHKTKNQEPEVRVLRRKTQT